MRTSLRLGFLLSSSLLLTLAATSLQADTVSTTSSAPIDTTFNHAAAEYDSLLTRLEVRRAGLSALYKQSRGERRDSVLEVARETFVDMVVDSLASEWLGVGWDFNGTAERPTDGPIACGYFVTTLLKQAGLKVERVTLAQQASEKIVKSLAPSSLIKRFSNVPLADFIDTLDGWGSGLYVVGLDYHVGFLYHDGDHVWFIHSTVVSPGCVIKERGALSPVLYASRYRVVGKISDNDALITKWLEGKKVATAR